MKVASSSNLMVHQPEVSDPHSLFSLKREFLNLNDQFPQIESFHQKFKLNKRFVKEWAVHLKRYRIGFQKILNISIPQNPLRFGSCCYQNEMNAVVDQTRQMMQHFIKIMENYEMQLTRQHQVLKEEGKSIYQVEKESKQQFKKLKASLGQEKKKLTNLSSLNDVAHQHSSRSNTSNNRMRSASNYSQRKEENNQDLSNSQVTSFLLQIRILRSKIEQRMIQSANSCLQSAKMIQNEMKEFSFEKLDKFIDPSVISLNNKKCEELQNQIDQSEQMIDNYLQNPFKRNISVQDAEHNDQVSVHSSYLKNPLSINQGSEIKRNRTQEQYNASELQSPSNYHSIIEEKQQYSSQTRQRLSQQQQEEDNQQIDEDTFPLSDMTTSIQNKRQKSRSMYEQEMNLFSFNNESKLASCEIKVLCQECESRKINLVQSNNKSMQLQKSSNPLKTYYEGGQRIEYILIDKQKKDQDIKGKENTTNH